MKSLPHPVTRSHLIDCLCARPCSKTFLCFLSSSLHHPSMLWAIYTLICVPIRMSASPSSHQHLAGPSVQGWLRAGKGPSVLCPGKVESQRPGDGMWVVGMRQGRRGGCFNQKRVFRSALGNNGTPAVHFISFFSFSFLYVPCGLLDLASRAGMEPVPLAVKAWITTGQPGKSQYILNSEHVDFIIWSGKRYFQPWQIEQSKKPTISVCFPRDMHY